MTAAIALNHLGLHSAATMEEIGRAYAQQRAEIAVSEASASTPGLKVKYAEQMAKLDEAFVVATRAAEREQSFPSRHPAGAPETLEQPAGRGKRAWIPVAAVATAAVVGWWLKSVIDLREADRQRMEENVRTAPSRATMEKPWSNSLGMKFVPVPDTEVLFCIHETRSKDFAVFMADQNRGYTMTGERADEWRTLEYTVWSAGRGAGERAEQSDHPVINVSWLDAMAFCEWLSKKEGRSYRLPTDAEWSKAVGLREGMGAPGALHCKVKGVYPWGGKFEVSAIRGNYADADAAEAPDHPYRFNGIDGYHDGFPSTAPVMNFEPNSYGIYDLGGNVWEWVAGCHDGTDPSGDRKESASTRVLRGGSWYDDSAGVLLSSYRHYEDPDKRTVLMGFRLVLEARVSN